MRRTTRNSTNNPNNVTQMLEKVVAGQPIKAAEVNRLLNAVNQLLRGNAAPSQVLQTVGGRGYIQIKITDVSFDDYVLGIWTDGTIDATIPVAVAKPYLLRNLASWNGLTYSYTDPQTREATLGSETEDQVVVPAYCVDDLIYVMPASFTGVEDAAPSEIKLIDANLDGRAWAKVSS